MTKFKKSKSYIKETKVKREIAAVAIALSIPYRKASGLSEARGDRVKVF